MFGSFFDVAETTDLSRLKSILGSVGGGGCIDGDELVGELSWWCDGECGGGGGCDWPQRFGGGTGGGGTKLGGVAGRPDCRLKISSSSFCIRCSAIFWLC